jgi:hypothetical protein
MKDEYTMGRQIIMFLVGVLMIQVQFSIAASFDCFQQTNSSSCEEFENRMEYCLWDGQSSTCKLSPKSLYLLCEWDNNQLFCDQASQLCSAIGNKQTMCLLQGNVCEWKDGTCQGNPTADGDPGTGGDEDPSKSPSTSPTTKLSRKPSIHAKECCNAAKRLCAKTKLRIPHYQVRLNKAKVKCGGVNTLEDVCNVAHDLKCSRRQ